VPVIVTAFEAASVTDAAPVLLKVTVVVALVVLIRWLANETGEGAKVTFAAAPVTVKGTLFEVPPPVPEFTTVIWNVPGVARSLVKIAATTWVELTRVVVRGFPPKFTVELALKPVPVTVSGCPGVPAGAVFDGESNVIVGAALLLTVKGDGAEVPPTGAGLNTVMATEPGVATSLAETVVESWVLLTGVVGRETPATCTTELPTKPVPFTVSGKLVAAAVEDGESELIVGTGFEPPRTDRLIPADVPLTGFETVMDTGPTAPISVDRIRASNCVELR
jgi:hypothetical protein